MRSQQMSALSFSAQYSPYLLGVGHFLAAGIGWSFTKKINERTTKTGNSETKGNRITEMAFITADFGRLTTFDCTLMCCGTQ